MSTLGESVQIDWETLVRRHQAMIWRYLRYLGAELSEADDLTQETFIAMAKADFTYRSPQETTAYLRSVARNRLLMARRRDGRRVTTVTLTAAEQVWVDQVGESGWDDYLTSLSHCWDALTGRARRVVDLFYREGEGREGIARELGMTTDGVKSLLRRTRQLLRACVERDVRATDE